MYIDVITVTGGCFRVHVYSNECTVLQLKNKISLQEGIHASFQALSYADKILNDSARLCDIGIAEGTLISLMVIPRSGPLSIVRITKPTTQHFHEPCTSSNQYLTRKYNRHSDWSVSGEEGVECCKTFTEMDKAEAERRADDNLRTMAKMKDIRMNIERMKSDKKPRKPIPIDDKCSGSVMDSVICSSNRQRKLSTNAAPLPSNNVRRLSVPKSAPEDTSAKESSAGETEFEIDFHSRPTSARPSICRSERSSGVPSQMKAAMNKLRPVRAVSSSSDQESSAAMLTASDSELRDSVLEEGDVSEYWSYDEDTRSNKRHDSTTDPSEMSSGMIVCDMDHEFRKLKVKRRYAAATVRAIVAPPEVNGGACGGVLKRGMGVGRPRPRSKARPPINTCNINDQKISTCEAESSTDDDAKSDRSVGHTPVTPIPSTSMLLARKLTAQMARVKLRSNVDRTQLNHKQPQSSQSQLRCATCGYRLTNTSTFHCRCGKTCCHKHRNPEQHMCSYFDVAPHKTNRNLGFVPECSD